MRRPSPIVGIFITVLLDLLSFGMFLPDLQLRVRSQAADMLGVAPALAEKDSHVGWYAGLVIAGFSLAQLLASPYLGGLSDRIGRRPVLLVTCALAAASNLLYAFSDQYWLVFVARVLSGLGAANLGVAFAYIADVTPPEERATSLGKLGAAFGIGFTIGPPLGVGLLALGGRDQVLLGVVASVLAVFNYLWVYYFLPESLSKKLEADARRDTFFAQLKVALTTKGLSLLLVMFFLVNLAFASLQSTFFLLLADSRSIFHLNDAGADQAGGFVLGFVGLFTALMQILVVPHAVRILGETKMLRLGLILLVPGLGLVPFLPLWPPLILGVALQAIANGLLQPAISSLISRSAPARIQGGIFGINQALGAGARGLSPFLALPLLTLNPYYPYVFAAACAAVTALMAWYVRPPAANAVPAPVAA